MGFDKVAAVIFEGGNPGSQIEQDMGILRQAIVKDNIERFRQVPEIDKIILVTNYVELRDSVEPGVIVDFDHDLFHFGKRLQEVINKYDLEAVFYIGGAAGPLLNITEIGAFCREVIAEPHTVLTNNVQSADIVVFAPAQAINRIQNLPTADNSLANRLHDVGLRKVIMPDSMGIHFDIDTPTDMLVLSINPKTGEHTRKAFETLNYDTSHLLHAKNYLALPYADGLMSGRVGAPVLAHINAHIRCYMRVYSEERGMKSLGREQNNLVESLVGGFMEILGAREFLNYLSKFVHVAFIDSRVLFAHKKLHLSDSDRFYSDLLLPEKIENEWLKAFTQAVKEAPFPVVVGGHSLVSGGMWSLIETIIHERKARYSPNKVYDICPAQAFIGLSIAELRAELSSTAKLYAVTRHATETRRAYTFINPAEDVILGEGWYLHITDHIEEIKKLESQGWELRFPAN